MHEGSAWSGERLTRVQRAALVFLLWTAVGVFLAVPETLQSFTWHALIGKLTDAWAWALLTPAILLIDRKLASNDQGIGRSLLLFLLLGVPFTLIHTYLSGILLYPFPQIAWNPLRDSNFAVYYFLGGWGTYCAFVSILLALRYYNRFLTGQLQLERVEKSLLESRLHALRLHLEPHFLFNALNAISSEVATDPALARNMIGDLGALLRRSLDSQDSLEISLAQELTLLDHYLSIQRVRFGDRIDIQIDVEPDLLSAMVPPMLLQPLVENAFRHGIEGRLSGGKILVSGARVEDRLRLQVVDNGVGISRRWQMEGVTGHGLGVTLERLKALYPGSGDECLTLHRRKGGGTEVVIEIPLHRAKVGAHEAAA